MQLQPNWSSTSSNGDVTDVKIPIFFDLFLGFTGELSTFRQIMKVPNEPGLSPNNALKKPGCFTVARPVMRLENMLALWFGTAFALAMLAFTSTLTLIG